MHLAKSTITSKYQTTVPKEIRQRLALAPSDVLQWELHGNEVRVTAAHRAFLERRGTIPVGPGSTAADVRRLRAERGTRDA